MSRRDRERAAEFAALMAARDKRRAHPRNIERAERNRRSWLMHHRHGVETFVAGCLPCEDAPIDRDPFGLSIADY